VTTNRNELGRRERKKQATRDGLRHAALELMAEHGFEGVTVEQICERADVATSTFFRHFPTKEDVVLADLQDRGGELLGALDAQPAGTGPTELLLGALVSWRSTRRPPEVLRAESMLLATEPALQARLGRMVIGWEQPIAERLSVRYGLDVASVDVQLAAAWLVTSIRVVIREWASGGGAEDVFDLGAAVMGRLAVAVEPMLAPR
jgi:AcrR family transcriptional regulator